MSEQQTNLQKWQTRAYMGLALCAACFLLWVLLQVFGVLWQAVAVIITTAIIAFMLHGMVNWLERKGLSRGLATALSMGTLLLALIAFFVALGTPIAEQIAALAAAVPSYVESASNLITQSYAIIPADNSVITDLVAQASQWITEQSGTLLQNAAGGLFQGVFSISNALLIFFISLICAFWILVDLPTISRELMSLFTPEQQRNVRVVTGAFNTAVYGWAKATLTCAAIVGALNGLALWLLGVPYFALLGIVCAVLYFIPYIGSIVSTILVGVVGLLVSPLVAVVAVVINAVVGTVVANFLSPKLMESSVNVHPALILIAILVGGALGGIVGMLFSIPVAAAIQGVFVTFFEKRTGKTLATEDGALFQKPKVKFKPTFRKPGAKADAKAASEDK